MKKYFFIFSLLLSAALHGQKDSTLKGWAVTFTGTSIPIGQPGVGIQPGVEYRFNERWCLLSEMAIRINKTNSKDSSTLDKHYFKIKSELRYNFFSKKERWSHDYVSFQISWAARKFINTEGYYYDNPHTDSVYYYSKAAINSPIKTVSVQFGSIITEGRFALDAFFGIGARFIHTAISNVLNPVRSTKQTDTDGLHFTASYSYPGNITRLHLIGGVRFMWHFYNFKHPRKP